MAKANKSVLIPFAPFTKRNTRPTLATRTTRRSVGDTKYLEIKSLNTRPKTTEKKNNVKAKTFGWVYENSNVFKSFRKLNI